MPSDPELRAHQQWLSWQAGDIVEADDPRAESLEVVLPVYHETLRPTYAVPDKPSVGTDGSSSPRRPARHGYLFNPDRYPFLEGRGAGFQPAGEAFSLPHVADGVSVTG